MERDDHQEFLMLRDMGRIEAYRRQTTQIKSAGLILIAVLGLVLYVRMKAVAQEVAANKSAIAECVRARAAVHFAPRVSHMRQQLRDKLVPRLKETVAAELKKRQVDFHGALQDLQQEIRGLVLAELESSLDEVLAVHTAELAAEMNQADGQLLYARAAELKALVMVQMEPVLDRKMVSVQGELAALAVELDRLGQDGGKEINADEAQRRFVAAILDLIKYDVLPEAGAQLAPAGDLR